MRDGKPLAICLTLSVTFFIGVNGVLTTNTLVCALLGGSKPHRSCELTILPVPGLCKLECKMPFLSDLHPTVVWHMSSLDLDLCAGDKKWRVTQWSVPDFERLQAGKTNVFFSSLLFQLCVVLYARIDWHILFPLDAWRCRLGAVHVHPGTSSGAEISEIRGLMKPRDPC